MRLTSRGQVGALLAILLLRCTKASEQPSFLVLASRNNAAILTLDQRLAELARQLEIDALGCNAAQTAIRVYPIAPCTMAIMGS
jgi:short subunit dehydrogenase-like uncharacterized protein